MTDGIIVRENSPMASREFIELVGRCYKEKPAKEDLRELQKALDQTPELWLSVFDMTDAIRQRITALLVDQPTAKKGLFANMQAIKAGLGYDLAPQVERLLIDAVVTAWLRWQWAELRYTGLTGGPHSISEGEYWLQVLGSSQRRYLRAVETLARVRRITRATLQINIAEAGSQQVNIAGDVTKN